MSPRTKKEKKKKQTCLKFPSVRVCACLCVRVAVAGGDGQNVVAVRGPEPAAVPAAVRILPFSGESRVSVRRNRINLSCQLCAVQVIVFHND